MENLKTIIRNVGKAGIPIFGYNFSIAGVAGRVKGPFARGEAEAVGMDGPFDKPLPNGMVWNMVYDPNAAPGNVPSATPRTTLAAAQRISSTRWFRWPRKPESRWRRIRTIRRCRQFAPSRDWFISRSFTRS